MAQARRIMDSLFQSSAIHIMTAIARSVIQVKILFFIATFLFRNLSAAMWGEFRAGEFPDAIHSYAAACMQQRGENFAQANSLMRSNSIPQSVCGYEKSHAVNTTAWDSKFLSLPLSSG